MRCVKTKSEVYNFKDQPEFIHETDAKKKKQDIRHVDIVISCVWTLQRLRERKKSSETLQLFHAETTHWLDPWADLTIWFQISLITL